METWHFKASMEVVESIEWLTNVIRCKTAEQRRALLTIPRISYTFEKLMDGAEFGAAMALARKVGKDDLYVPDWPSLVDIAGINAGTVSLPVDASQIPAIKAGECVMIWESWQKWERVRVTGVGTGTIAVSATTQAYSFPTVVALRIGSFMQDFEGERVARYARSQSVFQCLDTEDLSGTTPINWTIYKDAPVMSDAVELINGLRNTSSREVDIFDSKTGYVSKYAKQSSPSRQASLGWTVLNAAALYALRTWLHDMRGRFKSLWAPSWNSDLTLTRDIALNDTTVEIAAVPGGFSAMYPANCDFVALNGGTPFCFRVVSSAPGTIGREILTLESGATFGVPLSSSPTVCRLTLSRFDTDRIEIQHLPGKQATIVIPIVETPVNT